MPRTIAIALLGLLLSPVKPASAIDPDLLSRTVVDYFDAWHYLAPQTIQQDPGLATNQDFLADWSTQGYDVTTPLAFSDGGTLAWQGPSPAPFVYGEVDAFQNIPELTTLTLPPTGQRYTHYFRTEFDVDGDFTGNLSFNVVADDGAIVWIDGVEVFRFNCCTPDNDPAEFTDLAQGSIDESPVYVFYPDLPEDLVLGVGTHTLAVEVHNASVGSSDLGFLLRMNEDGPAHPWDEDESGEWLALGNWDLVGMPDSNREIAIFGDVITEPRTIVLDEELSLRGMEFDSAVSYTLSGLGRVTLDSTVADSTLDVLRGNHEVQLEMGINNNTQIQVSGGASLTFNNTVFLQGHELTVSGAGRVQFNNGVETAGGSVVMAAASMSGDGTIAGSLVHRSGELSPGTEVGELEIQGDYRQEADATLAIEIRDSAEAGYDFLTVDGLAELDGRLAIRFVDSAPNSVGNVFHILRAEMFAGSFHDILLPQLPAGSQWDLSRLYAAGTISIVPEPAAAGIFAGLAMLLGWRRTGRRDTPFGEKRSRDDLLHGNNH